MLAGERGLLLKVAPGARSEEEAAKRAATIPLTVRQAVKGLRVIVSRVTSALGDVINGTRGTLLRPADTTPSGLALWRVALDSGQSVTQPLDCLFPLPAEGTSLSPPKTQPSTDEAPPLAKPHIKRPRDALTAKDAPAGDDSDGLGEGIVSSGEDDEAVQYAKSTAASRNSRAARQRRRVRRSERTSDAPAADSADGDGCSSRVGDVPLTQRSSTSSAVTVSTAVAANGEGTSASSAIELGSSDDDVEDEASDADPLDVAHSTDSSPAWSEHRSSPTAAPVAATTFGFGGATALEQPDAEAAPAATASTFSFGAAPAPAPTAAASTFSFGAAPAPPTAAAATFSFGAPPTRPAASTATAAASAVSGGSFTFGGAGQDA